ncbi:MULTISPECIES: hypothetical protein [Colwellia]|uniref:Uncharacterized protein n=1 Tax=Colwellia marinimaniae TaxID=1513592 RepID=A0ABQ0MW27_9GAMM|nr:MULTISPECIES: hypothetical protein [Colwellia]GAW96557.1 hypothetical protein MTCD1_02176 [Colwellia marinimaniae]
MDDKYRYIFQSLIYGSLSTIAINIPLGGMLVVFGAFPLLLIFPDLATTSEWVEYGPFWLTIKKEEVWLLFWGYYILVWGMFFYFKNKRNSKNT